MNERINKVVFSILRFVPVILVFAVTWCAALVFRGKPVDIYRAHMHFATAMALATFTAYSYWLWKVVERNKWNSARYLNLSQLKKVFYGGLAAFAIVVLAILFQ